MLSNFWQNNSKAQIEAENLLGQMQKLKVDYRGIKQMHYEDFVEFIWFIKKFFGMACIFRMINIFLSSQISKQLLFQKTWG